MRHWFSLSDANIALWVGFALFQLGRFLWSRIKSARRDRLAEAWAVLPGRVGSVNGGLWPAIPTRLVVTYKSTAHEYLIDSWTHDFASKGAAMHAKQALIGWECPVRYNPDCPEQTTLLWADVKLRLTSVPYLAEIKPLTRAAYRWVTGWAVVGLGGFALCLTAYAMAMVGTSVCLCETAIVLMVAALVVVPVAFGLWAKLAEAVSDGPFPRRLWNVMDGWERWMLGLAMVGTIVSVVHFGPMFRAIPLNADIPDKIMAGLLLALVMPGYLYCGLGAVKIMRQRKPVAEATGSAALA